MKKFMKVISAGLSALIGMSVMTGIVSAEMDAEYMLNEDNLVWGGGDSTMHCYENGEVIRGDFTYMLCIIPDEYVTAEDLGVEFADLSYYYDDISVPENAMAVEVGNSEELVLLCDDAQSWYENGLISYAKAFKLVSYKPAEYGLIQIKLKEPDENYNPLEYNGLENAEFIYDSSSIYEYRVYEIDQTRIPEIFDQLKADERVEDYSTILTGAPDSGRVAFINIFSLSETVDGDVTGDDNLNLYDAIEIAKYIMEMVEFDETQLTKADYNEDGYVNLYDVIDIAMTLM